MLDSSRTQALPRSSSDHVHGTCPQSWPLVQNRGQHRTARTPTDRQKSPSYFGRFFLQIVVTPFALSDSGCDIASMIAGFSATVGVMMTVHKLSTGDGHLYYTNEVASGDQLRAADRELGDYYQVTGMPPGQWIGSGTEHFGLSGQAVTEEQMDALFGSGYTPLDPEKLAEHRAETYRRAYESKRAHYASQALEGLKTYRNGGSESQIVSSLGIHRSTLYRMVSRHEANGNLERADQAIAAGDDHLFLDNYVMSKAEERSATSAAKSAVADGNDDWKEATRLGKKPGEYDQEPVNDFTRELDEQYRRHFKTKDAPPNAEERKEIRNRVAGEQFRQLHGRDGSAVEIAAYIANNSKPRQQSVAGFDHVFTPTKSVSMAWGLGDESLRTGIESAHEAAINDVIDYLDEHAIYARRGQHGREQIDTDKGLVATKFRHYDSRSGDPNLHDHLVIANRVKGADGKWSTLDGRLLYQHGVAASELYNARIMHHINTKLGLEFTPTEVRGKRIWELAGISRDDVSKFSARSVSIKEALDTVEAEFIERHGHAPTPAQRNKLAQQATLATRPEKNGPHSLEELNQQWATKAKTVTPDLPLGENLHAHLKQASTQRAGEVSVQVAESLAMTPQEHVNAIMDRLESTRSTWRVSNINAEATRYFTDIMGGHPVDTDLKQQVVEQVIDTSVSMTPALNVPLPQGREFTRSDGTSIYLPANREVFTSEAIIANEAYLVDAAVSRQVIPAASAEAFDTALETAQQAARDNGYEIDAGQQNLARELATSDKLVAFGIGPAGAGKTTASKIMVNTWTTEGATVHGLAPTAVAADVLGKDAGITATTIDSFLTTDSPTAAAIRPGDVFLVDEVGMVSTPKLAELVSLAEARGAVVRGIGDDQQLGAIGAGGALRLIDREAGCTRLDQVHRFRNPENPSEANLEEAAASLALREPPERGPDKPFDWYLENNRVQAGGHETMVQAVFADWVTDTEAGKLSLMMAPTNTTVAELNELAQARAIRTGAVDPSRTVTTHNDVTIHPGDRVLTRNNNHRLGLNGGKDFVKNGDLWNVLDTHDDGRLTVQHGNHHGKITLPSSYVSEWVELGYASTINRAQGATVDVARAVVDQNTERSDAYVALSRGKYANHAYVETGPEMPRDQVLENISQAYETNLSVHELASRARAENRNPAERIDLYNNLSVHASEKAMEHVTGEALGVTRANELKANDGWGALAHELADATEHGLDPAALIKTAHDARGFDDADDEAAVLHYRIKNLRARHENIRDAHAGRPLANITDDHLDRLIETAKASTDTDSKRDQLEDPHWDQREFGMVPTDQLNRRRTGLAETMRDDDKQEYRWLMAEMDAEVSRRRWSSPAQKQFEEIARGERPRSGHNFTIQNALVQEKELRGSLLPTTDQHEKAPGESLTHGVSEHTASTFWMNHEHTPQDFRSILEAHHQDIGELTVLRGKQIAAEKPAWAEALGEVPANRKNAAQWHRVAGEVDAYRAKYNIPDSEQRPIPKQHARSEEGAYLQAQVTEVHKRGALSNRTGHSQGQNHVVAEEAAITRSAAETPTEAETKIGTQPDAAEKKWEEALMDMDTQWDEVITAWQQEETARTEHETAEEHVEEARQRVQEEKDKLDTIAEDLQGQVTRDYAPVARAEQGLEEANFFTRGSRTKDLEEEREKFKTKYGFDDPDAAYNQDWLEKDDTYSAQKTTLAEADEALETAHQRAQETGQALETAHQSTQEAYDSYAEVREENPATRVARPGMDGEVNQDKLDRQRNQDMTRLQMGTRPTDAMRNNRSLVQSAQARAKTANPSTRTNAARPAALQDEAKQSQSRKL
ncbi:relaxase domain-containing protein [Kocuria koreensis]|uniref:Relaxase domain-containing protein n=2 Tax=Rothia koreensis TaxID=592378 RepID=A0A7M3SW58_9MICC|nr:relaxase domain-containing protein [Rothia koreensis]